MFHSKVIAIDGPSGVGKSSGAKLLAKRLKALHVDTGSMYRALALAAHKKSVDLSDDDQLNNFLADLKLEYTDSKEVLISVGGVDYTGEIRSNEVGALAGKVAAIPSVREFLVDYQRSLAGSRLMVMEGRDIGTVVFSNAFMKFFVTASPEIRAERRWKQLVQSGRKDVELDRVLQEVIVRDKGDIERSHSPLVQADDAVEIKTDGMDLEQVVDHLVDLTVERAKQLGIPLGISL